MSDDRWEAVVIGVASVAAVVACVAMGWLFQMMGVNS